jgi:hypothetical protein
MATRIDSDRMVTRIAWRIAARQRFRAHWPAGTGPQHQLSARAPAITDKPTRTEKRNARGPAATSGPRPIRVVAAADSDRVRSARAAGPAVACGAWPGEAPPPPMLARGGADADAAGLGLAGRGERRGLNGRRRW